MPEGTETTPENEATETEAPETTEEVTAESGRDLAAELDKWKKLSRQNEAQAKANAEAAKAWAKYQETQKSDEEKRNEALTAAEKRAAEAENRLMRLEIAAEKGLTPAQAKRLVGSTREEMEQDADELLETFAPAPKRPANPDAGARSSAPSVDENDLSPAELFQRLHASKPR